jgi:hypothetical protein
MPIIHGFDYVYVVTTEIIKCTSTPLHTATSDIKTESLHSAYTHHHSANRKAHAILRSYAIQEGLWHIGRRQSWIDQDGLFHGTVIAGRDPKAEIKVNVVRVSYHHDEDPAVFIHQAIGNDSGWDSSDGL